MATKIHVEDGKGNSFTLTAVDGITFPEYFSDDPEQRLKDVRDMKGRDDDIIIVAYPKAGTHWVWELTNMLLRGSTEYHQTVKEAQMLELTGPQGSENLSSPRVFNSHLRFRQLPKDMISRNCKMIYVTRNPKDMAVSRYMHNVKGSVGYKGTFSDYLPLYLDGKVAFGSWFDHTVDWEQTRQDNQDYPIHEVHYEDLTRNPVNQVERLAGFLGVKSDPQFIREVCDRCSFTKLKESYKLKKGVHDKDVNPNEFAFRKGVIGDWKNWFTVAESELFDNLIDQKLKGCVSLSMLS